MSDRRSKSMARSLGEFFGHLIHGIRSDPSRRVVRREVETQEQSTEAGRVVLRRTTIEEIEIRPEDGGVGGSSRVESREP